MAFLTKRIVSSGRAITRKGKRPGAYCLGQSLVYIDERVLIDMVFGIVGRQPVIRTFDGAYSLVMGT